MNIIIHRGIDQIGGCITEIATDNAKILIDLGQNLPDGEGIVNDDFANFDAIEQITKGIDAIFYTHYYSIHDLLAIADYLNWKCFISCEGNTPDNCNFYNIDLWFIRRNWLTWFLATSFMAFTKICRNTDNNNFVVCLAFEL